MMQTMTATKITLGNQPDPSDELALIEMEAYKEMLRRMEVMQAMLLQAGAMIALEEPGRFHFHSVQVYQGTDHRDSPYGKTYIVRTRQYDNGKNGVLREYEIERDTADEALLTARVYAAGSTAFDFAKFVNPEE